MDWPTDSLEIFAQPRSGTSPPTLSLKQPSSSSSRSSRRRHLPQLASFSAFLSSPQPRQAAALASSSPIRSSRRSSCLPSRAGTTTLANSRLHFSPTSPRKNSKLAEATKPHTTRTRRLRPNPTVRSVSRRSRCCRRRTTSRRARRTRSGWLSRSRRVGTSCIPIASSSG